jgi:hypothetical protein
MPVLLRPRRLWSCPNCSITSVTREAQPHTQFHTCAGLRGLSAPMIPAGTRAEVVAVEREDYVGSEKVQTDANGRPVMAVITRRPDGSNDTAVFAPTATVRAGV